MIAVIFEVTPAEGKRDAYLARAAGLRPLVEATPGFISVERFESLTTPGKMLSLSFFEDEAALETWRRTEEHRLAQTAGRNGIFSDYRLRIAHVLRDYGLTDREEAPDDSRAVHDAPPGAGAGQPAEARADIGTGAGDSHAAPGRTRDRQEPASPAPSGSAAGAREDRPAATGTPPERGTGAPEGGRAPAAPPRGTGARHG